MLHDKLLVVNKVDEHLHDLVDDQTDDDQTSPGIYLNDLPVLNHVDEELKIAKLFV